MLVVFNVGISLSCIQCVYHMPVDEIEEAEDEDSNNRQSDTHKPNMAEALQRLFYNLQTSETRFASPSGIFFSTFHTLIPL